MTDTVATTRRREATRQRLLDAAAQVFAEVGLDAASVEAISERAGFTRGAFYSNFETKDELFLELAARVARDHVEAVHVRVAELEQAGGLEGIATDAFAVLHQVLGHSADERLGVLLMSEIRIRALRDPALATAYLAWEAGMTRSVAQIIADVARAGTVRFRMSAEDAARLMIMVWETTSVRAVMEGLDDAEMSRRASEELARVAQLIIEP